MTSGYLSEIELYYSTDVKADSLVISGDELHHLSKVMRHSAGQELWVTDGKGKILNCRIKQLTSEKAEGDILETYSYDNTFERITFCLPLLKHNDRLEFALEKCTELGITKFIIYTSERTITRTFKKERWVKIVLSAMKQSLRSYLPLINFCTLKEISSLEGEKILFDQNSGVQFSKEVIKSESLLYFIIGPEGGLSESELSLLKTDLTFRLAPNRLRSETAAVTCASLMI